MGFYSDQHEALAALDKVLKKCEEDKQRVKIDMLIYNFLKSYPVGEKKIKAQILRYCESKNIPIDEGEIVF